MAIAKPAGRGYVVKQVEAYNFKQPKLFSKEIMRTLRTLHDVLARNLGRVFSTTLRKKVDVHIHKIDQITSRDFLQNLESPSVIYLTTITNLNDEIISVLPSDFCIHMIERQSGGKGDDFSEKRILTTIEEKIISRIMRNINREIAIAWEPYKEFEIGTALYESKPENIHLTSVDPAIIVTLLIDLLDRQVEFKVSYSYSLLKLAMSNAIMRNSNRYRTEKLTDDALESYKRTLLEASINIQPLLGTAKLSVKDIITLKEGDTVSLKQRTDKPLAVRLNGVKKMTAYPGIIRGRRAVKIFEVDKEINEQELL